MRYFQGFFYSFLITTLLLIFASLERIEKRLAAGQQPMFEKRAPVKVYRQKWGRI